MEKVRKIVFYASIAVIAAMVLFLVWFFYRRAHEADVYKDLQATAVATPAPAEAGEVPVPEAANLCPVDFDKLHETTPNIYAWIEIPGMDIAYPVVQSPGEDDYYLKHDISYNYNDHGAIYSHASVNGTDFSEYHVILYGHNFEDGTMFSNLTNYRDSSVLDANRDVYIYTPQEQLHYRIFAAVTFSDYYLPYLYKSDAVQDRQAFLDDLPDTVRDLNNHVLDDPAVTADDKLLILSTCTGKSDRVEHRYLVVAKLEERTPWDAAEAP